MSPRAAWRFESLGFPWVYTDASGKADWLARAEPPARLVPRLHDKGAARIIVKTPDGRLVGVAERPAAERRLAERGGMESDHD